jgi:multidrug efflux pump subunit AcrA (membrane-fusion protein)
VQVKRKTLYIIPVLIALVAGIILGHLGLHDKQIKTNAVLYYVDPMHPSYRSDKPGIAPDCGMKLVPVDAKDAGKSLLNPGGRESTSDPVSIAGKMHIEPATQQLYGIRLTEVQRSSGRGIISVFGRVAADGTRIYRLNLNSSGFVKETENDAVGSYVRKDQRLAAVYSSEVLYAAAGYISGNTRMQAGAMTDIAPASQGRASISAQSDYLRNLGMSDSQIKGLNATHRVPEDVYIVSPTDGFILTRSISTGLRFEKDSEFYTIADLSHVWVYAEVFGRDAQAFRPGTIGRIVLSDTGESYSARVANALPEIDPATRTLKIRLEVDNPKFRLRPDMFVNVELPVVHPSGLTVPSDALLDSGLSKRVFVESSEGYFEAREVETGWQLDGRVQIVKGLREGEFVASEGTFLIDSESRLQVANNAGGNKSNGARVETAMVRRAE